MRRREDARLEAPAMFRDAAREVVPITFFATVPVALIDPFTTRFASISMLSPSYVMDAVLDD